jgi:hypothetical protein
VLPGQGVIGKRPLRFSFQTPRHIQVTNKF